MNLPKKYKSKDKMKEDTKPIPSIKRKRTIDSTNCGYTLIRNKEIPV